MDAVITTFIPSGAIGYSRPVSTTHRSLTGYFTAVRTGSTCTLVATHGGDGPLTATCTAVRYRVGTLIPSCIVSCSTTLCSRCCVGTATSTEGCKER